ncbi:MAG TPA: YdcF family protein [Kofleriaceae bacterium]
MTWNRIATALERILRGGPRAPISPSPRDAIVVLGAALRPSGRMSPVLAERAEAGAALYHAGGAPLVIATGGPTRGAPRAEADAIAERLRERGVPAAAIVVERAARSTADNARFVAALLPRGASVWLVTQPFHARRAELLFARAGLDARAWPFASRQARDRRRATRWLVREAGAWVRLMLFP